MMPPPEASVFAINTGTFRGKNETDIAPPPCLPHQGGGMGTGISLRLAGRDKEGGLQSKKSIFGFFQRLPQFRPPLRVREIPGADEVDALYRRPLRDRGHVQVRPTVTRVTGMNLNVGNHSHTRSLSKKRGAGHTGV